MSDHDTPQDAPRPQPPDGAAPRYGPATAWTTWVPASGRPGSPTGTTLDPGSEPLGSSPTPVETAADDGALGAGPGQGGPSGRPEVTYLPAPTGPNWGLVVLGLFFVLVAVGVAANQLAGFQVAQLTDLGPSVLVVGGLACAVVGVIGILARRR